MSKPSFTFASVGLAVIIGCTAGLAICSTYVVIVLATRHGFTPLVLGIGCVLVVLTGLMGGVGIPGMIAAVREEEAARQAADDDPFDDL